MGSAGLGQLLDARMFERAFHPGKAHHGVRQEGEQAQTSVPEAPTLQNFNQRHSTLPDHDSCASQRLEIVSVLQFTKNVV